MNLDYRHIVEFFKAFRFNDFLDILVVSFIIYRILLLIQGTRAFQMVAGLSILVFLYFFSEIFQLLALNWLLHTFLSSILILIIILFQEDIRRALAHIGTVPFSKLQAEYSYGIEEVVKSVNIMVEKKIGGLIVFEREISLKDYLEGSVPLDSKISEELLISIFNPKSPLHDGAVIISGGKILAAGVVLPLSTNPDIAKDLGTRHRAGLGITEVTDAVAVIVSEERGQISLAVGGKITRDITPATLRKILSQLLGFETKSPWWKRLKKEGGFEKRT
ncbi:MAG: diadenylate cyclase CdaA [Caldimicrobium sp.]|nr:diadenylate cyclase CdaA [Caldimicrobium sp.]MCX7613321.1 diadenylate cyclase CdaA [Caldimicrobium sp.]MDW8183398.1 diadenylate cyclase CdaA [Caldimicrobium sp.]